MTPNFRLKSELEPTVTSDTKIRIDERDHQLHLWSDGDAIASATLSGWSPPPKSFAGKYLERMVWTESADEKLKLFAIGSESRRNRHKGNPDQTADDDADDLIDIGNSTILRERLVSFPSSPQLFQPNESANRSVAHTMRIIDLPERGRKPVDRIFLLHNGLDELLGFEFFYDFSASLLQEVAKNGENAACIIRPFPLHQTRYPQNPKFAATPLEHYLSDSGRLFVHYLRYMVETQWLLSILAPRSRYQSLSGSRLTGTDVGKGPSRATTAGMATAIRNEFHVIRKSGPDADQYDTPAHTWFRRTVSTLRSTLGIEPLEEHAPPGPNDKDRPAIHVLGYSLGGFMAQSAFLSWPYVIASCSTICSGGALEELTPVSFAHPEEWQTLTHSLRYRLDDLLRDLPSATSRMPVNGLRQESFDYFKRVFYETFEQHYRASYQTRVSEYLQRMLFVVGGSDPVVRPRSVLDAAPAEGSNLIEVGGLSHFVSSRKQARNDLETEQREFWFPEIGRLLSRWAPEAERVWQRSLSNGWRNRLNTDFAKKDSRELTEDDAVIGVQLRSAIGPDGAVGATTFESVLDAMAAKTESTKGFLFILRNDIPTFMLSNDYHLHRAKSLHHSEDSIRSYLDGLKRRQRMLERIGRGVVIVVPHDAMARLANRFEPGLSPATGEVPVGEYFDPRLRTPEEIIEGLSKEFQKRWIDERDVTMPGLWMFHPGSLDEHGRSSGDPDDADTRKRQLVADLLDASDLFTNKKVKSLMRGFPPSPVERLPDCWMWMSPRTCLQLEAPPGHWTGRNIDRGHHFAAVRHLILHTALVAADPKAGDAAMRFPRESGHPTCRLDEVAGRMSSWQLREGSSPSSTRPRRPIE